MKTMINSVVTDLHLAGSGLDPNKYTQNLFIFSNRFHNGRVSLTAAKDSLLTPAHMMMPKIKVSALAANINPKESW